MNITTTWGYSESSTTLLGPSKWFQIAPECAGNAQSPIDINTNVRVSNPLYGALNISYTPDRTLDLANNGHTTVVSDLTNNMYLDDVIYVPGLLSGPYRLAQYVTCALSRSLIDRSLAIAHYLQASLTIGSCCCCCCCCCDKGSISTGASLIPRYLVQLIWLVEFLPLRCSPTCTLSLSCRVRSTRSMVVACLPRCTSCTTTPSSRRTRPPLRRVSPMPLQSLACSTPYELLRAALSTRVSGRTKHHTPRSDLLPLASDGPLLGVA